MSVQVHDRRFKPLPWDVQYGGVAADCRWAWDGLLLAWPIWGSLGNCVALTVTDPIRKRHGSGALAVLRSMVSDVRGPALYGDFGAATGFGLAMTVDASSFLPTTECTIVLQKRRRDGNTSFQAASDLGLQSTSTTAERLGLHAPWSDGTLYFNFGGTTTGTTQVAVAGLTYGDDVFICTTGPRGMEVWQNGLLVGSNAATPTRSASTESWGIGENGAGLLKPDNANYGCVLLYDRQLSPGAIKRLSRDPWTPFRPALPQPVVLAASGAASVTPDVGALTLTGFPPSVSGAALRVTQAGIKVLVSDAVSTAAIRSTQAGIKALVVDTPDLRVTQAGVKALLADDADLRVTHAGIKALAVDDPDLRVTQAGVKVLVAPSALSVPLTGLLFPRGSVPPF